MIKDKTSKVKDFIKGLITSEMSAEDIQKHEDMLKELEDAEKEEESYKQEINVCKDKIVSLIKTEGNDKKPQDDQNKSPRSLEEIINDISGGK